MSKFDWTKLTTREEAKTQILKAIDSEIDRLYEMKAVSDYVSVLNAFRYEMNEMNIITMQFKGYPCENLALLAQTCMMMLMEGILLANAQGTKSPSFPKVEDVNAN